MSTRSILTAVLLVLGIGAASADNRTLDEAKRLVPSALKGWTATPVSIETHAVLDTTQIVATRTYTTPHDQDRVTITIDTFNPVMTAFIEGTPRAGTRRYDLGPFHGIASGPEANPSYVALVIEGNCVLSIVRARGDFELLQYLYEVRYTRLKDFARRLQGATTQASL